MFFRTRVMTHWVMKSMKRILKSIWENKLKKKTSRIENVGVVVYSKY